MDRRQIGILGEVEAARHYRALGYELVAANFRTRQGEIDLIAEKNSCLVFIEVKTRTEGSLIEAREAVTRTKQRKLIAAAGAYLSSLLCEPKNIRFDVVEVYHRMGAVTRVSCIENAFGE
ncbi:MAG: YraN family protein [Pygmaiobacter massiliensis]|uniref:YraN family protein n=1 Tax=Pygmaiobacter massiliensis TaxID=1917873 RepID=UPI00289BBA6D|nr:YraN family protein [Pygmaiobacter massiliensis]